MKDATIDTMYLRLREENQVLRDEVERLRTPRPVDGHCPRQSTVDDHVCCSPNALCPVHWRSNTRFPHHMKAK